MAEPKMLKSVADNLGKALAKLDLGSSSSLSLAEIQSTLVELKEVGVTWLRIKATLADADEIAIPSDPSEVKWLADLRKLTYMAEDLHDLCEYQLTANRVVPKLARQESSMRDLLDELKGLSGKLGRIEGMLADSEKWPIPNVCSVAEWQFDLQTLNWKLKYVHDRCQELFVCGDLDAIRVAEEVVFRYSRHINEILEGLEDVERKWRMIEDATPAEAVERAKIATDHPVWYKLDQLKLLFDSVESLPVEGERIEFRSTITPQVRPLPLADSSFWNNITKRVWEFKNLFAGISQYRMSLQMEDDSSSRGLANVDSFTSPLPSESLPTEDKLFGREEHFDKLLESLQADSCEAAEMIGIVGMGGVGKTSLAQHIFQHMKKSKHFNVMGWVFMSDDFELERLTLDTFNAFTGNNVKKGNFAALQVKLQKFVCKKRFFLVLENIWNIEFQRWETYFAPFQKAGKGSKILITAREEEVARRAGAVNLTKLGCLTEKDGWSLFQQYAFQVPHEDQPPDLVTVGKGIVKKCGLLPLAIKLVAIYLRNEHGDRWRLVLESNLWKDIDAHDGCGDRVLGSLYISYLHLPPYLKACFKLCSLFHRGEKIYLTKVADIWMAHSLIRDDVRYEKYAEKYIFDLISRSFFELKMHSGFFVIHDLLFDLLQYISDGIFYQRIDASGRLELPDHVRFARITLKKEIRGFHLRARNWHTLHIDALVEVRWWVLVFSLRSLRTLHMYYSHGGTFDLGDFFHKSKLLRRLIFKNFWCGEVPESLCKLYNLRHLDISESEIFWKLPSSIGNLENLTHLNSSWTDVRALPWSVADLTNLQILNMQNTKMSGLPRGVTNLTKLKILDLCNPLIDYMPSGISRLTELRSLPFFPVGKAEDGHAGLLELKNLPHLKDLHIKFSGGVCIEEVRKCDLRTIHFRRLTLTEVPEDLCEELRPHSDIRDLEIDYYRGILLPTWMGDTVFANLNVMSLRDLNNCSSISRLQTLPYLEKLLISGMTSLKEIVHAKHSLCFQRLKRFTIEDCDSLESIPLYKFPALLECNIHICRKLESIDFTRPIENPENDVASSIEKVVIKQCRQLYISPDSLLMLQLLKEFVVKDCEKLVESWEQCRRDTRFACVPLILQYNL